MFFLKNHLSLHRSLFFLLEGLLIFMSIFLAATLRFSFSLESTLSYQLFLPKMLLVTGVCQLCFYYNDLYGDYLVRFGREALVKIFQALLFASLIIFTIYFAYPSLELGRGIFLIALTIVPIALLGWRHFYSRYMCKAFRSNVLIIGTGGLAKSIGRVLVRRPDLGYEVVGFIDKDPKNIGAPVVNPRVIGDYQSLPLVIDEQKVDYVVVAIEDRRGALPLETLLTSRLKGIKVEDGVGFYERVNGKISVDQLRPSWLIFGEGFRKGFLVQLVKRTEDIVLSVFGLLVFSPIILLLSVLIKFTSSGPVFYRQERLGQGGKPFMLYKFRSMDDNAEKESGPVWAQTKDPRVTALGRIIRKLRLDEIPQMVNVLKGDMSFVGPRPERLAFVRELKENIPYYDLRFSVKPGITGWAQVCYHYGGTMEGALEKLQYELYYMKNMSLTLDLIILLRTLKVVIFQKGAR